MIKKITPDGDLISIVKSKEIGVQDRLVECTNEQKRVLDGFKSQKMFSILGGAGTGKTVLAIDAVRKKTKAGKSSKYILPVTQTDFIVIIYQEGYQKIYLVEP